MLCSGLMRNTHIMCNVISDWDCVVDCFDQIYMRGKYSNDSFVANKDLLFLSALIDRFPAYSTLMNDESLVKFVTSLVALSMNTLTSDALQNSVLSSGSESFYADVINVIQCSNTGDSPMMFPQYLSRGLQDRNLSFSFKFAIETAKFNSFRIASIWQMVISHIRIMASMKVFFLLQLILSGFSVIVPRLKVSAQQPWCLCLTLCCRQLPCLESRQRVQKFCFHYAMKALPLKQNIYQRKRFFLQLACKSLTVCFHFTLNSFFLR
jgi:hypothetical protein